jgi:hypothetical protein
LFFLEKDEITDDWWSFYDEKLHDFHCSYQYSGGQMKMKLLVEAYSTYETHVRGLQILVLKIKENVPFDRTSTDIEINLKHKTRFTQSFVYIHRTICYFCIINSVRFNW